ncbi:MAG: helix-turn-helix transcriptional regulator [Armatimonadota bacterium]|nr:helix-turn-helix transcriptional regulator [Armatimonadota bacterium]
MEITVTRLIEILDERYGDPERFTRSVREWLRAHRISQADLARATGYTPPMVSRWLNLRTVPSLRAMLVMDEAIDVILRERGVPAPRPGDGKGG